MEKLTKGIILGFGFDTVYDFRQWVLDHSDTLINGFGEINVDAEYEINGKKGNRKYTIPFSLEEIDVLMEKS